MKSKARKKTGEIHDPATRSSAPPALPPPNGASGAENPWQTIAQALERLDEGEAALLVLRD